MYRIKYIVYTIFFDIASHYHAFADS